MNSNQNIDSSQETLNNSNLNSAESYRKLKLREGMTKENNSAFESRLTSINEKIDVTSESDDQKFKLIKDRLAKLQEGVAAEKIKLEQADDIQFRTLELLENACVSSFTQLAGDKKEKENALDTAVNDRFVDYKMIVQKERQERQDSQSNLAQSVNEQLSDINGALKAQVDKRQNKSDEILNQITKESEQLVSMINNEKQLRIEHHNSLQRMLDEISEGLNNDIQAEKRQREHTEESILKLLEETCKRVEISLND